MYLYYSPLEIFCNNFAIFEVITIAACRVSRWLLLLRAGKLLEHCPRRLCTSAPGHGGRTPAPRACPGPGPGVTWCLASGAASNCREIAETRGEVGHHALHSYPPLDCNLKHGQWTTCIGKNLWEFRLFLHPHSLHYNKLEFNCLQLLFQKHFFRA